MESKERIELIKATGNGDKEAAEKLWNLYRRFICQQANRKKRSATIAGYGFTVDSEDLIQSAWFALLEAAKSFNPDKGHTFIGWLNFYLMKSFSETLGTKTKRDRSDPINRPGTISLDAMIMDFDMTLGETIPDPADPFAPFEEADFQNSIRGMIADSIRTAIPDETAQRMFLVMLDHDFNISSFKAYRSFVPSSGSDPRDRARAANLYHKYIHRLRSELRRKSRMVYYEDYYFPSYSTSYDAWQRTGMSAVERTVFKRDEMRRRMEKEHKEALERLIEESEKNAQWAKRQQEKLEQLKSDGWGMDEQRTHDLNGNNRLPENANAGKVQ